MYLKKVSNRHEKKKIMEKVDSIFIRESYNYDKLFEKINKYAVFIAAYEDDEPTGYIAFYCNDIEKRIAYITMIGVKTEMQRKHIGSELMNLCFEESEKRNMCYVRLEVLDNNTKAICFYQSFGFVYESKASLESSYFVKKI